MQKIIFTINNLSEVANETFRLCLDCGFKPDVHSGEFVDVALEGRFLRRPFAVADVTETGIIIYFKVVGEGTAQLAGMKVGQSLELLVGLGHGYSPKACETKALVAGGGLGAAPLFLLAKELVDAGKSVSVVLGFNTAADVVLLEEYRSLGLEPLIVTVDGSAGVKGFVSDYIGGLEYDYFYTCGPMVMMKAVCEAAKTGGECSLEERMGCGAGFCYGCTCRTLLGAKRVCKDGPVFRKEEILWN